MPDLGWSEILALAVIAIVVVGPRELPGLMRQFARFTKAARQAAHEFRESLDELARETELEDIKPGEGRVDYDTPEAIIDPTTGQSVARHTPLPEEDWPYEPPTDSDEDHTSEPQKSPEP